MCLDSLNKKANIKNIKYAYKVFDIVTENGKEVLDGAYFSFPFKKRKWLKDTQNNELKTRYGNISYKTGFHCYLSCEDAIEWRYVGAVIHKVIVRNIVAIGKQYISNVANTVVAKEIFIMEEIKCLET
jgi:hypothetical protein